MPRTKNPAAGPSKRRRTEEVLMKATFINERAEAFYHSSIVMKKCIPERGVLLHYTGINDQIKARRWSAFVGKPEAAVVPVVREFYANAKEQYMLDQKTLISLVRGQVVLFDRNTINEFYKLENVEEDEYTTWLAGEPNGDEVLQLLAKPGGRWEMHNEQIRRLQTAHMTVETKAWHYFICGKLLPSNHYSDATKDRAFLNYALQTGLSINVGKIIEQSIISQLTGRVTGGLGHPSLIYQLCLQAGVIASPAEEIHHPSPMITHKMLNSFERQLTAAAAEGGAAPAEEAGPSSRPETSRRPSMASIQTSLEKLEREQAQMKHILQLLCKETIETKKELKKEQRRQRARQDQAFQESRQQFAYISESMQTLAALLQGNSSQAGTSSLMPSPPRFSVYPPPTPPESSEEEEEEDDEDSSEE